MAKTRMAMGEAMRPRDTAMSPEECMRDAQMRAQMIEASQGGRYAGSPYAPKFDDPPVRPVKSGR